ncbi:pectate lyase [Plantactinospora solaniradicis]|uniref:pectate lyase n=1 Tax=Plantactinospora solaniradicis TaxID=1723736 RepID=A0ABW1KBQ2_9ACTN
MFSRPLVRRRWRRWSLVTGAVAVLVVGAIGFSHTAQAASLFNDDFEDGNTSGWSKSGGTWAVVADGSQAVRQSNAGSENARLFAGTTSWTSYAVQARVKPLSFGSGGQVGLLARATGSTTFYRLALLPGNQVQLQAVKGSTVTVIGGASRTVATGTWYTLAIEVSDSTVRGTVDGAQVAQGSSSVSGTGRIGLQTVYASAAFDDVSVTTSGTNPPTPNPTTPNNPPTTAPPTTTPPSTTWPTPTGNAPVNNGTIQVTGTFDGGMRRYCCIGDGGQGESQDPVFELAAGATIQNVILGAPAGDGIHCEGNCTIRNVWWEDVGEDAATFRGGSTYNVIGGGARAASDKVFQHNGSGTVHISGFYAENIGKLYRACGNCSSSYQRHVVMDNVTVRNADAVAGINTNWGDTARFTRITIYGDAAVCQKYRGVSSGSEPVLIGEGADGVNCIYSSSDITYR